MSPSRLARLLGVLPIVLVVSACGVSSAFDDAMSGVGFGPSSEPATTQAPPPQPVATGHTPDQWCGKVAAEDRVHAQKDGFDAATQQRRYRTSYRQCVALLGAEPVR